MHTPLAGTAPMSAVHSVGCAAPKSNNAGAPESEGEQDFSDTMEDPTQRESSDQLIAHESAPPNGKRINSTTADGFPAGTATKLQSIAMSDNDVAVGTPDSKGTLSGFTRNLSGQPTETANFLPPLEAPSKSLAQPSAPTPITHDQTDTLQKAGEPEGKQGEMFAHSERQGPLIPTTSPLELKTAPPRHFLASSTKSAMADIGEKPQENVEFFEKKSNVDSSWKEATHNERASSHRLTGLPETITNVLSSDTIVAPSASDTAQTKNMQAQHPMNNWPLLQSATETQLDISVQESERADRVGLEPPPPIGTDPSKTVLRPAVEQVRGISMQMAEAVQRGQDGSIDISLRPEELGRLRMSLQPGDGTMHVILQAERADTMDLLRRHIATLQQEFLTLGYENFSFEFSSQEKYEPDSAPDSQDEAAENDSATSAPVAAPAPNTLQGYAGGLDLRV